MLNKNGKTLESDRFWIFLSPTGRKFSASIFLKDGKVVGKLHVLFSDSVSGVLCKVNLYDWTDPNNNEVYYNEDAGMNYAHIDATLNGLPFGGNVYTSDSRDWQQHFIDWGYDVVGVI